MFSPMAGTNGLQIRWQSVSGQTYFLERGSNLGTPRAFAAVAHSVVGQAGSTLFTDTNTVGAGPFFYRVGVSE
jgi:hypothetical protein